MSKVIERIEIEEDDISFVMLFADATYLLMRNTEMSQRYMTTDVNLVDYIGATYIGHQIKPFENDHEYKLDVTIIETIEVETDRGLFSINVHNIHNGNYVKEDGIKTETIYGNFNEVTLIDINGVETKTPVSELEFIVTELAVNLGGDIQKDSSNLGGDIQKDSSLPCKNKKIIACFDEMVRDKDSNLYRTSQQNYSYYNKRFFQIDKTLNTPMVKHCIDVSNGILPASSFDIKFAPVKNLYDLLR